MAKNKKLAKLYAAEAAMEYIRQHVEESLQEKGDQEDDTMEDADQPSKKPAAPSPVSIRDKVISDGKNPVSVLNEIHPGIKFEVVSESGQSHNKLFVMSVTVEGNEFKGQGNNKKVAKSRAAQIALKAVYNITFVSGPGTVWLILLSYACNSMPNLYTPLSVLYVSINILFEPHYTRLLNEITEKQRLPKIVAAIFTMFCLPRPWLKSVEFWLFCKAA